MNRMLIMQFRRVSSVGSSSLSSNTAPRLFDQPFSLDGLGSTLWYVYMHGIFGDADDAPEGAESWHASLP